VILLLQQLVHVHAGQVVIVLYPGLLPTSGQKILALHIHAGH